MSRGPREFLIFYSKILRTRVRQTTIRNLNLLVSLRVLLTQRHVTRSAEKLGLTQPAMSASLARSRTLFRDKLLVRGPQGLVLTPRGEQILEQLNKVMEV